MYIQNSIFPQQYPRQNAQLGNWLEDIGDAIGDGFAALDPTNHKSWLGEGLHNVADWGGDITGIDAQEFQQGWTMVAGTVLNIVAPGAGTALAALSNATWAAGLAADAAETHASAVSDQMNANIEKARLDSLAGIETVAAKLAAAYPASPELVTLYRKSANDALNALFSGDMQTKVNNESIKALNAIINGSLISAQKLAAQQKEFDILNPPDTEDDTESASSGTDAGTGVDGKPLTKSLTKASTKAAGSDNTLMYVGISVGVLAILGIGTAVYMKNKKEKDV